MSEANIPEAVKQKYGEAAKRAASGGTACCGGGAELTGCDPITKDLYTDAEKGALPGTAVAASLGCGNPSAFVRATKPVAKPAAVVSSSEPCCGPACCA
jgi:hypothetical protein